MKVLFLAGFSLVIFISQAQVTLSVCQTHGHKDWFIFYKDGSDTAAGYPINDSCMTYQIPVTEPCDIAIVCEENLRHILHLWIDPRYRSRSIAIDNESKELIMHDTIPVDRDNAPYEALSRQYELGRFSHDSLDVLESKLVEDYIRAHPDSFLSVRYLQMFMYSWDIAKVTQLRDLVSPNNATYSVLQSITNFIDGYKYKNTPKIGDDFMEFRAQRPDGSIYDSKASDGKVVVLFFWYSGCGPCKRVIEPLTHLYDLYKKAGMELISIATDEDSAVWHKTCRQYSFPGINVSELKGFRSPLASHYAVNMFPSFVVFDRQKKISLLTYGEEVPLIESKVKE
ncbi:MAG: thiol:disulfide interchange protein TlpA like family, partial [Bacteroidetes bacterium]|nr:thiol:disulfide interchange protein TlpA like family [Bacteroidota bacterium]